MTRLLTFAATGNSPAGYKERWFKLKVITVPHCSLQSHPVLICRAT